jgi:hypothetical protein
MDWQALGWEAHAVWFEIFRKLDTAGVIDLGKHGSKGFSVAIGMPFDVLERGLKSLLEDGCLVMNGSRIVMPNYVEAQEARKSDRLRQRDSRIRFRDSVMSRPVTNDAASVTFREEMSREQEVCHVSGATVAEERRGEENRIEEIHTEVESPVGVKKRKEYSEAFGSAWKLYVRGEDKAGAFKEWQKASKEFQGGEAELLGLVIAALSWQIPSWKSSDREFPNHQQWFVRYLTHRRWEDEPAASSGQQRSIGQARY